MDGAEPRQRRLAPARPAPAGPTRRREGKSERELLVYRSNLLGADLAVTNFGGGNTSAKLGEPIRSPARRPACSGSRAPAATSARSRPAAFARLYLDKLVALEPRFAGPADEDRMAGLYPYAAFEPGDAGALDRHAAARPPALRAHRPCAPGRFDRAGGRQRRRGGGAGDLRRHGRLDPVAAARASNWRCGCAIWSRAKPDLRGVILAGHGLIGWGETVRGLLRQHARSDRPRRRLP